MFEFIFGLFVFAITYIGSIFLFMTKTKAGIILQSKFQYNRLKLLHLFIPMIVVEIMVIVFKIFV